MIDPIAQRHEDRSARTFDAQARRRRLGLLAMLVVLGIVLRVALYECYEPIQYPDTATYIDAARDLAHGDLSRSMGRRTPGYPLLMLAAGIEPRAIVLLQFVLGLLTSILLFHVAAALSGRAWLGFAAGMSYNLNLQQLFVESALLSEAASTASVLAVVLFAVRAIRLTRRSERVFGSLVVLGIFSGIAILVRPQFVFLLLLAPLVAFADTAAGRIRRRAFVNAALVAGPCLALLLAWCSFVFAQTGHFALSTQSGFGLANHSVAFVELAPDRYAAIRDVLLNARAVKMSQQGHYGNSAWLAFPELSRVTGLSLPDLSSELQRMSIGLFVAHPFRYAASVAHAWIDFWAVPIVWEPQRLAPEWLRASLDGVWWVEHKLLRVTNLAFVLLIFAVAVSRTARIAVGWSLEATWMVALILFSSVIQALADNGASARYAMTVQALLVMLMICAIAHSRARSGSRPVVGVGTVRSSTSN